MIASLSPPPSSPKVILFYGRGGSGHLSSARALQSLLEASHPTWVVSLHDASAIAGAAFGDGLYNALLVRGLSVLLPPLYAIARFFQPVLHPRLVGRFEIFFRNQAKIGNQDVVVSCVPFLNAVLCDAAERLGVKMVTVMTDFTNSEAHPWLQHDSQIVFCGTDVSEKQAKSFGKGLTVRRMSGMVVHPRFYEVQDDGDTDNDEGDQDMLRICMCFGGCPPGDLVKETFRAFRKRDDVKITVICGRNRVLKSELENWLRRRKKRRGDVEEREERAPTTILGCVDDVAKWMRRCDVVVGKPGPGVVSEAMVTGRPLVLIAKQVMEQEKSVVDWVKATGIGIVVHSGTQAAWLSRAQVELMEANLCKMPKNNAVFEVVSAIEKMIAPCTVPSTTDNLSDEKSAPESDISKESEEDRLLADSL